VGKTTLVGNLLRCGNGHFAVAVTTTTRPPREGEIPGRDYHFVDGEIFQKMVAGGEFYEHSTVHGHHSYGVTKAEIHQHFDRGRAILLNTDVQGAQKLLQLSTDTLSPLFGRISSIFLLPPPRDILIGRIQRRGPIAPGELERRMASIQREVERSRSYDYRIPAGTINEVFQNFLHIYQAESMRTAGGESPPEAQAGNGLPGKFDV
jgi:guanylate kinase